MYLAQEGVHVRSFTDVECEGCVIKGEGYRVVVVVWLVNARMNQCLIEIEHQCLLGRAFNTAPINNHTLICAPYQRLQIRAISTVR
jgi:hypothetical protein